MEARSLLEGKIEDLRGWPYDELRRLQTTTEAVTAPSGKSYQLEVQTFWDDKKKKKKGYGRDT